MLFLTLISFQETDQPKMHVKITTIPSEPVAPGTCKFSTAGYLEMPDGRVNLTENEIGNAISEDLKQGYVVTVYPKTKRGIFVSDECPSETVPASKN